MTRSANFLLFIILFCFYTLFSQSVLDSLKSNKERSEWFLSTQIHYGWLWKHREKIQNLPSVYPYAWELDLVNQTKGQKEWHWANNMPRLGIQLLFINMRNVEIYGNAIHTTPYADLILARGNKSELFIKLGLGLAFYSNYFHVYRNQHNQIISSPASYSGTFGFSYKRPFVKNTNMIMAVNFNHASNATIRQPNLGSNIISGSWAIERRISGYRHFEERIVYKSWRKSQNYKALHFFFFPSFTIK
ncbi:MAG: acyloxyacyl hydrolase, partial [Cytophagales bacterium]